MGLTRRDGLALLGFIAVVALVATAASLATLSAPSAYQGLRGPAWAPPAWVFGPVWTVLYALVAVAGWLAWRAQASLVAYAVQLVLNGLWSPLFFGLRWRGVALACIVLLDLAVAATVLAFRRRSRWAAWLLAPYLLWVLFATVLNAAYWWLNR